MKIAVIGCGLIGITTAYFLQRRNCEVTVVERHHGAGCETSFANGALLHPSMAEPWNSPGCWRVLLASLYKPRAAMQLRLRALPSMSSWGVKFLVNSRRRVFERSTLSNLRLGLFSLDVIQSIREDTRIEYGRSAAGTLRIFRDSAALQAASAIADRRSTEGLPFRMLSRDETTALEPALEPIAEHLAGALYYEKDEIGDAYRFCTELTDFARRMGVEFRFGCEVKSLKTRSGRIEAVVTDQGPIVADRYIVAAGSYSVPMLRGIGVQLPVRPAKGYSITFETYGDRLLGIPIIDDQLHAAVVPIDGRIRVAGTAEFSGYDVQLRSARIRNLLALLQKILPQQRFDLNAARAWCGLRPMSVDGVPIIGSSPISNLWLNTGHGHLGWTLAAGSARLLAELLCGDTPSIDPEPFLFSRFR